MLSLTFAEMRAHARRLAGTVLAVFLGISFLAGTLVLSDTLRSNFDELFAEINAGTDVVVRSDATIDTQSRRPPIDPDLVDRVQAVDGVAAAEGTVEGYGKLLGADGEAIGGNGPPQLAGSWTTDPALNPYQLAEGRAPRGGNEVVVNRGAAEDGGLDIGDRTTLLTPEPVEVTIVGLATFGDQDGLGGTTFTAFTLEDAVRHLTGGRGGITSVVARGEDGVSQDELVRRVTAQLPSGVEAVSGDQLTGEFSDDISDEFLSIFTTALTAFAGIAVLVASFSIHNTFSILVAQRSRTSALLRALGATRRQVVAATGLEMLVVGIVASLAGLAGGLAVAGLLKALFDTMGFALPAGGLVFSPTTVVVSLVVGVVVTALAGLTPTVTASQVPPLAALRDAAVERTDVSRVRVVLGALAAAVGVVLALLPAVTDEPSPTAVGAGGALAIVGVVLLGPVVARPLAAALGAPAAHLRGVSGMLARRNATRNPRRTAATATALTVGVGMVALFTVFAASLRSSVDASIDRSFSGDLAVVGAAFDEGGLSPALADDVRELPEVREAVGLGRSNVRIDGSTKQVTVADVGGLRQVLDLRIVDGGDEGRRADAAAGPGPGEVAVSETTADSNGWDVGDVVPVLFPDGATSDLRVAAVYEPSEILGGYLVDRGTWEPHSVQDTDALVLVDVRDDASPSAARDAVESVAERYGAPEVTEGDQLGATLTAGLDMGLGVVYALLTLAIVIAIAGIANTLALAGHERRRELGLLRAVGQTRAQLRSMVRWESVLVAVVGAVTGIVLGSFLGWALVRATSAGAGGLGNFALPVTNLAVVLLVGAAAGVLASIRPARRAARQDVLGAIATE